jgi:amino acid transporter
MVPFQEVHTRIPMSRELMAWIIGWAIMEYAIGISRYILEWFWTIGQWRNPPQWVQMDYLTSTGYRDATALMGWKTVWKFKRGLKLSYTAWTTSPAIGSFHFVADLPALFIIILITALVYRGMKESRNASNVMVVVKLYYPSGDRGRRILCRYG